MWHQCHWIKTCSPTRRIVAMRTTKTGDNLSAQIYAKIPGSCPKKTQRSTGRSCALWTAWTLVAYLHGLAHKMNINSKTHSLLRQEMTITKSRHPSVSSSVTDTWRKNIEKSRQTSSTFAANQHCQLRCPRNVWLNWLDLAKPRPSSVAPGEVGRDVKGKAKQGHAIGEENMTMVW